MARRTLSPDEQALWNRVKASAKPLQPESKAPPPAPPAAAPAPAPPPVKRVRGRVPAPPPAPPPASPPSPRSRFGLTHATLDGGWDRRLRRGMVEPDMVLDLHGHTLTSAHALLESTLERAVARGARVVLVIAGRQRPQDSGRLPHEARPRGAIRASLAGWLAHSPLAHHCLALRPAHQRHGGAGAVYLVLRRD